MGSISPSPTRSVWYHSRDCEGMVTKALKETTTWGIWTRAHLGALYFVCLGTLYFVQPSLCRPIFRGSETRGPGLVVQSILPIRRTFRSVFVLGGGLAQGLGI